MVLTADGLLDKGFFQYFSINDDGITIIAHGYLWSDTEVAELDAKFVDHELFEVGIETRTAISGNF